jgi:hypothetical protein
MALRGIAVDNTEDILDSRNVIDRREELETGYADEMLTADEEHELLALRALCEKGEDCSDWEHGEALIRHSHFTEYVQQFADDAGYLSSTTSWPYTCIDWDRAAGEVLADYTEVDFDGVVYYVRS